MTVTSTDFPAGTVIELFIGQSGDFDTFNHMKTYLELNSSSAQSSTIGLGKELVCRPPSNDSCNVYIVMALR